MESTEQAPKDLIGFLDFYLVKKAPFQLPDNAKEWIVHYGPWITVVLLILSLPPLLFVLGLGAVLVPFGGVVYATNYTYAVLFLIAQMGLMIAALPGLFNRKMSGWTLLFYSQLLSLAHSIIVGAVIGGLLGALISLYILFQVRPLYTN